MSQKSAALLRVLLNHFHDGTPEALLSPLPEKVKEGLQASSTFSKAINSPLHPAGKKLQKIHHSWLAPTLGKLPKGVDELVLSALPEPHAAHFPSKEKIDLPPRVKEFILHTFTPYFINEQEVLPVDFLPDTPLASLMQLNKKQLLCLVDFLSMYDLAHHIRHIVDKKVLAKFTDCLTQKEQQFLHTCLHKKESLAIQPFQFDQDKEGCIQLRKRLHLRGLSRFGVAISGEHSDFIWHLCHKLDKGRGTLLMDCASKAADPMITKTLLNQIRKLLHFLNFKNAEGTRVA